MKNQNRSLLIFFGTIVISAILLSFIPGRSAKEKITLDRVAAGIRAGEIASLIVEGNSVTVLKTDGTEKISYREPGATLPEILQKFGVTSDQLSEITFEYREPSQTVSLLLNFAPLFILALFSGGLIWFMLKQAQAANSRTMGFGQSSAKEFDGSTDKRVTFSDVAGNVEAKEELEEIVDFLKKPQRFMELGARIPRGVLLVGSPGTGKTLLARAVAGEAKVPFFHLSGSEFVEMFVGVGASRVRDLFRRAKKQSPAIVFIDEIDAVGRQRGAGLGGSHDEREQTLNQILVEMDGFDNDTNIIVMAATNRPDVLDPALLRPGRFDRQVTLDLPDVKDREAILKVHAVGKPFAQDVDFKVIAERTAGFSGADLANVLNEAALLAGRRDEKIIHMATCLESIEKVMLGPERKSHILSAEEKKVTAYHEAGHALVAHHIPEADPVHKVSIISRGRAGGYTMKVPSEDRKLNTKAYYQAELAVLLAGHTTEKETFGQVTTGASNDLKRATKIARAMVTQFGMSEVLGARTYGEREEMIFLGRHISEQRDYSEKIAAIIDAEVDGLLAHAQSTCRRIISQHKEKLDLIASTLIEKETLEQAEFYALAGPRTAS
jgi:cell division protease FtsH